MMVFWWWHPAQRNMLTPIALKRTEMHGHASSECHQPRLPDGDRRSFDTADSVRGKNMSGRHASHKAPRTPMHLHTSFCRHALLIYTQALIHTGLYTHKKKLGHTRLYIENTLKTNSFTRKNFYAQVFSKTDALTNRYWERSAQTCANVFSPIPSHTHTETATRTQVFYTENVYALEKYPPFLYANALTNGNLDVPFTSCSFWRLTRFSCSPRNTNRKCASVLGPLHVTRVRRGPRPRTTQIATAQNFLIVLDDGGALCARPVRRCVLQTSSCTMLPPT